jgi:flagellar FliL protein
MPEDEKEEPKPDQETEKTTDKKSGSKRKTLKFVLIPVVLLVQAVAAYFIVFKFMAADAHDKPPEEKKESHSKVGLFHEVKDLVVNPAESMGRRYLVVEIGLETTNEEAILEATSKEIWIRDGILSSLNTKTADDLLNINKRDSLKVEILGKINAVMTTGKFEKLYFTKYIMQ